MFNRLVSASLRHRLVVLAAALILVACGAFLLPNIPVDVFPDLNRPIVTLMMTKILQSRVVQTDETPVKVQDHERK